MTVVEKTTSQFLIYALHHPESECVYIGKTVSGMRRAVSHLHASVLAKSVHTPKSKWVILLRANGYEPEIVVLEECLTADSLNEAEKYHIEQFRALGLKLLNNKGKFPRKQTFHTVDGVTPKRNGTAEERRIYFRAQARRWRINNPEKAKTRNNRWRQNNLDRARAQSRAAGKRYLAKPEKREAQRQYHKEYGKTNRDKISNYNKSWKKKNPEKMRSYFLAYDQKNRDKRKADARERRKTNTIHVRLIEHKWRKENIEFLKKKERIRSAASGVYNTDKVMMRIALFGGVCAYCGGLFEHLDHVIAIAKGGSNWPANFRPACKSCNLSKGAKDWRKWKVLL